MTRYLIAIKTNFNILKSRNIPGTLLQAIVEIYTQHEMLIECNSKLSKLAEINYGILHFPSLAYSV
jgi:hypothetical protein